MDMSNAATRTAARRILADLIADAEYLVERESEHMGSSYEVAVDALADLRIVAAALQ